MSDLGDGSECNDLKINTGDRIAEQKIEQCAHVIA